MMLDESLPRPTGRGAALAEIAKEDLEVYAVEELSDRMEALEAEVQRTREAMNKKRARRDAADALFSFKS